MVTNDGAFRAIRLLEWRLQSRSSYKANVARRGWIITAPEGYASPSEARDAVAIPEAVEEVPGPHKTLPWPLRPPHTPCSLRLVWTPVRARIVRMPIKSPLVARGVPESHGAPGAVTPRLHLDGVLTADTAQVSMSLIPIF